MEVHASNVAWRDHVFMETRANVQHPPFRNDSRIYIPSFRKFSFVAPRHPAERFLACGEFGVAHGSRGGHVRAQNI